MPEIIFATPAENVFDRIAQRLQGQEQIEVPAPGAGTEVRTYMLFSFDDDEE